MCVLPFLFTSTVSFSESALTTDMPTPCSPPETWYVLWSNFPPAWSFVMTTSRAGLLNWGIVSTGIPLPLSSIVTLPSLFMVTVTLVQCPASDSSTLLSTIS